ncbi:MAG: AAA family ATPase [Prevotella sp.]|nr:AAA family ATPase [Prevotella sp.]
MALFQNGEQIGLPLEGKYYKVQYLIKENSYCETYRVVDERGDVWFLKIYIISKMPERMLNPDGTVWSICLMEDLVHENILPMQSSGIIDFKVGECQYIITEYFGGELLEDKINREGPLPFDEALRIFKGILEGLKYLNFEVVPFISHNDITPRNIMLTNRNRVVIIDMGHLCFHHDYKEGKPPFDEFDLDMRYHATETVAHIYNEQTDLFSATAVFYYMLFGVAPWDPKEKGVTKIEKMQAVIKARSEHATLDFSGTKLTEKYREIIRKGLALNPKYRYERIDDLLKDLEKPDCSETPIDMPFEEDDGPKKNHSEEPKGFAAIAGMEELKKILRERVMFVLKNKRKAEKYKLTPPNGMLLYGPPGCGKTFFAEKFAEECGYNFMMTRMSTIGSTLVHGTEENIAKLFAEAEEKAPTLLCFDEFDAFVPTRTTYEGRNQAGEVNEFLTHLNNCGERGIFVVATSNRPDMIDPAVLRTGRIDRHIFVPLPDVDARQKLFKMYLQGRPCSKINTEELANITENYISSDIAYICNESAMIAAFNDKEISQVILEMVISSLKPSIRPDIIKMYDDIRDKMEGINRENTIKKIGFV